MEIYITVGMLVLSGIGLIAIEVIFVPGTTFVGIIGFLLTSLGVYLAFGENQYIGWGTLIASVILSITSLVIGLRGGTWEKFAIHGKQVNNKSRPSHLDLKIGDEGMTTSTLKPMGNALLGKKIVEVSSRQGWIEVNTPIKVIEIYEDKVVVCQI